jgi:hypothetical protein
MKSGSATTYGHASRSYIGSKLKIERAIVCSLDNVTSGEIMSVFGHSRDLKVSR